MDRVYYLKSGVKVICTDGGYLDPEEIKNLIKAGDDIVSVRYGKECVLADNR